MAASLNEFSASKLFLHKKANIIQKIRQLHIFFIAFIFYHRAVVKKEHYMTHLLSYANTVL
jgi:hypothetical protein